MQHFVISLCLILFLSSSNTVHAQSTELKSLAQWMEGSYSSQNQHLKDTANYFDIRLQIIPIWKDKKDGYWFYVEQAVADYIDKPYRQRVYHLKENEKGVFESVVLTLKDPLRFTHKPEEIEKLITDSLTEKEGCSVILSKKMSSPLLVKLRVKCVRATGKEQHMRPQKLLLRRMN